MLQTPSSVTQARAFGLVALTLLVLLPSWLWGAPVLHEYFDPSTQTIAGDSKRTTIPSRISTEGGSASAPRLNQPNSSGSYGQSAAREKNYSLDADTSRPDLVGYDDPFTPSIPPFKRAYAYDSVDDLFRLSLADDSLRPLQVGGTPRSGDDQFFADLNVALRAGEAVRIPSVGPGARVIAARLVPSTDFELKQDSAENWFVRAPKGGEHRLIMHLAIDRRVFGSPFGTPTWQELRQALPTLPDGLRPEAQEVIDELGVNQRMSAKAVVHQLVDHFRSFAPSEDRPLETGARLYQEIALSRKGVCRHRAFAFVVTALALGIPSRFVRNEAHAWVEVYDGSLWHRIDLGGAAGRMQLDQSGVQAHAPPPDPLRWPPGSESGADMAEQAMSSTGSSTGSSNGPDSDEGDESLSDPAQQPEPDPSGVDSPATEPDAPGAEVGAFDFAAEEELLQSAPQAPQVTVESPQEQATRGARLSVKGQVATEESPCGLTRVDIRLQSQAGQWHLLGTLVTDDEGRYSGAVTVPNTVPVGDYELFAVTPGSQECAAGNSLNE